MQLKPIKTMIKKHSYFKDPDADQQRLIQWIARLEQANGYEYEKISIQTSLGQTQIYGFNTQQSDLETLVIFPGFRTSALIWDLDRGLFSLSKKLFSFSSKGR